MAAHGITMALPTHPTSGPDYKDYMAHFDGHLDKLADAATNSGADLNQLSTTTTTQYTEIKALPAALKTVSNRTPSPISYATADTNDSIPSILPTDAKLCISQLEAAVCNNWNRGAFFSTHGWGVNENHMSKNFRAKKSGHVSTATRANPAGPGRGINKG